MSVTQLNVEDAVKELIKEIKKRELNGTVFLNFDSGNLVNVSVQENIGAKRLLEEYYFKRIGLGIRAKKN